MIPFFQNWSSDIRFELQLKAKAILWSLINMPLLKKIDMVLICFIWTN